MNIKHRAVTILTVAAAALATTCVTAAGAAPGSAGAARPAAGAARPAAGVPASFQPAAVSFWSARRGVALGGVRCAYGKPCRVRLAATADGGAHWRFLAAPRVWIAGHKPLVNDVVFASRNDGWLYGQGLWATHDGGRHWRKLATPARVKTMAAAHGTMYALAGSKVFKSPVGRDAWARVGRIFAKQAVMAASGRAVWVGTSTSLWATAHGTRWHKYPFRCPKDLSLLGISAASSSRVAFLCARTEGMFHATKKVLISVNGGRTEHLAGQAPAAGNPVALAVPPRHGNVITVAVISPGPDLMYRSVNGGKTWATITFPWATGGVKVNSLAYSSRTVGWVVVGSRLLRTSDAGRTWHKIHL